MVKTAFSGWLTAAPVWPLSSAHLCVFFCVFFCGTAQAQLELPHKKAAPTGNQPKGNIAPHIDCLVCGERSYTAHVDGRKDEAGHDLVWCDACKRDTPHSASVNTDPGMGSPEGPKRSTRGNGDLVLPRYRNDASTAPAPAPASSGNSTSTSPKAAPATQQAAPETARPGAAAFVFSELRSTRNPSQMFVDRAVENLVAAGESGRTAARAELDAKEAPVAMVAARVLMRSDSAADFDLVTSRLLDRIPSAAAQKLVEEIAARDPVRAGPEWLVGLLESSQSGVRMSAQRLLTKSTIPGLTPLLVQPAASRRTETRLSAVELASSLSDAQATDILLAHIDDASPRVASTAVSALTSRVDPGLEARLVAIAFQERWVLRRGAYALLAICNREDVHLQAILGPQHVEPLLVALDSSDAFVSGTAAVALAGIGFRSREARYGEWLDRSVPDRLMTTMSGRVFHDDLSSLLDPTLRRLRLVTGQKMPPSGPAWIDWWIGAREGFHSRRAELTIDPSEIGAVTVRCDLSGDMPETFALVGPDAAEHAESLITYGEIVYLNKAEISDLVAMITREGILSADKLPGTRGAPGRGQRSLTIEVNGRAKEFTLGSETKEPWFDRALEACRALRDRNAWQHFAESGRAGGALALWRGQSEWWAGEHPPAERDARMKALVLAALKTGTPSQRDTCIQKLEDMYTRPEVVQGEDYGPLLSQMTREIATADMQSDRARRLGRLALAAARKIGTDDMVPDVQAVELCSANSKLYGTNAADAVDEVLEHVHRSFLRSFATDERALVRAAVGRALARDPGPEDLAIVIKLLDDADPAVETASALSLGEHKVEAARTELLVRARVARSEVRCAALQAIGKLGGPYVLEALIQGLSDRDPSVRLAAAKGLAQLSDPAAAQVLIAQLAQVGDPALFDAARSGLVAMGPPAWPDLVRAINQPGGNMRREAALILSEQCQPEAASPLMSILTANAKDAHVALELAILTCVDARSQVDAPQAWWTWWDGVRHDDAEAWFLAALERTGMSPPPPSAFVDQGTAQGRLFLVNVMARPEPWLVERARREYKRLTGTDPGSIPAAGPERDKWIHDLRASATREVSRG